MQAGRSGRESGFTLMEMLIVVVIVGTLASIALPRFRRVVEQQYWRMARDMLLTMYTGERAYFFANNDAYFGPLPGALPWSTIHMENPVTVDVTFNVATNPPTNTQFNGRAQRLGTGPCGGRIMTINQTRTLGGNWINLPQNTCNCC